MTSRVAVGSSIILFLYKENEEQKYRSICYIEVQIVVYIEFKEYCILRYKKKLMKKIGIYS